MRAAGMNESMQKNEREQEHPGLSGEGWGRQAPGGKEEGHKGEMEVSSGAPALVLLWRQSTLLFQ